jgi:hypothetical protein
MRDASDVMPCYRTMTDEFRATGRPRTLRCWPGNRNVSVEGQQANVES